MKLKIKDFAEKYEIARQSAYRLIKEGTLIANKDNLLDENLSTNRYWIESRTMHLQEQVEEPISEQAENNSEPDNLKSWKIQNLRLDAEYKSLRNNEKAKKLFPVDVATTIYQNLCRHMFFGFSNFVENEFQILGISSEIPLNIMVEAKAKMRREIERLSKEAAELTKKDMTAYFDTLEKSEK